MKVLINSRIIQKSKSGIYYYVCDLYGAMQNSKPEDEFIFLQTSKDPEIGRTYVDDSYFNSKIPPLFDLLGVNLLIKKRKLRPDIFHGPAHILPLIRVSGVKYVVTVHDLAFMRYPHFYSYAFNAYYRLALKVSVRNADLIVADSSSTRDDLLEFFPKSRKKVIVMYCGINKYYLTHKVNLKRVIKEPYFFSVTTHPQRKNLISVLRALSDSSQLQKKYKFVIAGILSDESGKLLAYEIKRLKLEKQVILFGYATEEELQNLFTYASYFIYPSFYEGFGLPILESMICRCPVITSNCSSMVELIPEPKWLVNPHEVEDIRIRMEQMSEISDASRHKLIKLNYDFAKQFTWDRTAQEMSSAFNNILSSDVRG